MCDCTEDRQCDECRKRFQEHLDRASAIVATWPEWKRNLLGNSLKATNTYSRVPPRQVGEADHRNNE